MRLFAFLLLLGVTGCPAAPPPTEHARHDRLTCPAGGDDFQAPVKAAIQKFLAGVDPASKPVAVFDWDNTMIKNDIGAATLFHMVREGLVMRPHSWDEFSDLTDAARSRLFQACAGGGKFLPSREKPGCARALVALYTDGVMPGDPAPFKDHDHRTYRPTAAWQSHLLAGYTPEQVRLMARAVIGRMCSAPESSAAEAGSRPVEGYIRLHRAMVELVHRLRRRGFQIWVASASPQHVVEAFAELVGIPGERVIGIRSMLDEHGRLTHRFQGCGPVKDGENRLLTYIEGKRCWIRKVIAREAAFVAGAATTDISMLRDGTGLRLVIDRQYPELMCHALHGARSTRSWVINPMFYEPKPARTEPYPCSTTACTDKEGRAVPCTTKGGEVLPDII